MSLVPRLVYGDLDLTDHPFLWEFGGDLGAPENQSELIESLLQDGEIMSTQRRSNREISLTVLVEDADMIALAEAETSLVAEADKPFNTLSVDPGDGLGAVTVFETFTAQVQFVRDDDFEQNGVRRYVLTIPALPFGRSESETVVEALTVGAGSEATISDGTSATGWSSPDGAVTVSSGALSIPAPAFHTVDAFTDGTYGKTATVETTLTTAAIDFSTTPYLYFDHRTVSAYGVSRLVAAYADGASLPIVSERYTTAPTSRTTVFLTDSSVTTVQLVWSVYLRSTNSSSVAEAAAAVLLDDVKRGPRSPLASTTGRESIRALEIGGSARTQASLQVAHATAGLGDTIVYTAPGLGSGYDPSLRQYLTVAGSAEVGTVSGAKSTLASTRIFDIPVTSLPSGGYILFGRVRTNAASAGTWGFEWAAATRTGSADLPGGQSGTASVFLDTAWTVVPIAAMVLPPSAVPETSNAVVRLTLGATSLGANAEFDQLWLFYCGDDAALTVLGAGAGVPAAGSVHNRVWLDSPTLARPVPSLWAGTLADKSDAVHAGALASVWGEHRFVPGEVGVFVVTTEADDAAVSARYYKRHHTAATD